MRRPPLLFLLFSLVFATPAQSQGIPVIDVTAVANLVQQIAYWKDQLTAMGNQLAQLQQTFASVTGTRGMDGVMPVTQQQRNYLPPDYNELMATVNGTSTTYSDLTAQIQQSITSNAILTTAQLNTLTPEMRQQIESARSSAAMVSTLSQAAYQNTSQRFGALQQLITTIAVTGDLKSIQELQTRVAAEQTMLTNEQTKLQSLAQIAQADEVTRRQRLREQVIGSHGGFSTRFSPTPEMH
jgi:type IV secretion system protein VirB5